MQALLRLTLLVGMLLCCIGLVRHASRPDEARLRRLTGWLRRLTWANGALLILWLAGLAHP
ncbi:MAG: hypothetical protein JO171_14390 [Paludibacterium sp.]|uniref:hypothetical protein n=1 Tax=Paludibacterium sp. TaxID=1917523 RepID=UPI0025F5D656|nr:hypothetical protein [Paludibacterium sp.]MBV8048344.1 hypothetical protein [Paludibacterium sp.]MBV8649393.1 hypothetical protein [Paludibacterium sp.]